MHQLSWHHDYVGRGYDTNREDTRLERDDPIEYAITLRCLRRYVRDAVTVADIGVGGQYSEALARRDCRVHLAGVSQHLLDVAAARIEAAGLGQHIASVRRASATDLSHLEEGCCDVVLLLCPLYHLITPEERHIAIAEAARILRPGGLVFSAGINRLTYLRDVVRSDPDEFVRRRDVPRAPRWVYQRHPLPDQVDPAGSGARSRLCRRSGGPVRLRVGPRC